MSVLLTDNLLYLVKATRTVWFLAISIPFLIQP